MIKHILKLIWNKKRANALLFTEVFFSFLIVFAGSAFCIKSFRAYFSPAGFETEHIWWVQGDLSSLDSAALTDTKRLLKQELLNIEGVEAASFAGYAIPFTGSMWGRGSKEMGFEFWSSLIGGDEDINDIYQLNLVEGRAFLPEDQHAKYPPVIVNQLISDKYWDGQPLVDTLIRQGPEEVYKVVGVVDHLRYRSGFEEERETLLHFGKDHDKEYNQLLLRVAPGSGAELEEAVSKAIAAVLKSENFTIASMDKARQSLDRETWIPIVVLLTISGFILLNVALGLFGVLFYSINKRKGEIGLRLAMGATRSAITKQFTLEVFFVALAAMLLGLLFAVQVPALGLLEDEDFAHSNFYLAILCSVAFIGGVVLFCAYWPSRQGAGLHPATALHEE